MENKNGGKKKHGGPMSGMAPVEKAKDFKRKNLMMIQKKQRQLILKKCNNFTMLKNYEEQR